MPLKTMAMQVTPENYSVAAACLGGDFLIKPVKTVLGRYLVINALGVLTEWSRSSMNNPANTRAYAFSNVLLEPEEFEAEYELADRRKSTKTQFVEVVHV